MPLAGLPVAGGPGLAVPEGPLTIAQQFTAGTQAGAAVVSPEGTAEHDLNRPYGTEFIMPTAYPAMNRWAILVASLRDDSRWHRSRASDAKHVLAGKAP